MTDMLKVHEFVLLSGTINQVWRQQPNEYNLYFNKEGREISYEEFVTLFSNKSYQHIQVDQDDMYTVSTVWLGINHNFNGDGPPIIFESMVFNKEGSEVDCERAATLDIALLYHKRFLEHYHIIRANIDKKENKTRFEKLDIE